MAAVAARELGWGSTVVFCLSKWSGEGCNDLLHDLIEPD